VLHELVAQYAQTMLAEVRTADPEGGGLPRYVERELTEYLRCGVLAPTRSLHAGVVIAEHDRAAIERLCRYGPGRRGPRCCAECSPLPLPSAADWIP
jgi:hypothetical protein